MIGNYESPKNVLSSGHISDFTSKMQFIEDFVTTLRFLRAKVLLFLRRAVRGDEIIRAQTIKDSDT